MSELEPLGRTPDAPESDSRPKELLPDHVISGVTAVVLLLCVYSVLCLFVPTVLGVRANLAAAPPDAKPSWYFLFLYEYFHLVPPLLGALTPTVLLVVLGAWPYLDRTPSHDPRKRILALALVAVTVIAALTLTTMGWIAR